MARNFELCAPSFIRHVVEPNRASVLFFGPDYTDNPDISYNGRHNVFGAFVDNPKQAVTPTVALDVGKFRDAYGSHLVAADFHSRKIEEFTRAADELVERGRWLLGLNPFRILSMFYNIQGAARLLVAHETKTGEAFDTVLFTRTDLAFYSPVKLGNVDGEVHIPAGQGFTGAGAQNIGNAQVYHYKNIATGDYTPPHGVAQFNDQVIAVARSSLPLFANIYDDLKAYLRAQVPASPETILYLHLVKRAGLECEVHPEWTYEIVRRGARAVQSVLDTDEIAIIDPAGERGRAERSRHAVRSFLRDAKGLTRRTVRRIFR
jgi:hypothetical protein